MVNCGSTAIQCELGRGRKVSVDNIAGLWAVGVANKLAA